MIRVVLDANVLASALINPRGVPGKIIGKLLRDNSFTLIMSIRMRDEIGRCLIYPRVRKRIGLNEREIKAWLNALSMVAEPVEGVLEVRVVKEDPGDDIYVSAALDGRAEFVVSGDRHLLGLKEYEGVRFVNPRNFLEILERRLT